MTELLHAWALAPAAIGTCCLAADRRRVRAPELAASLIMLVAMTDAAFTAAVPRVFWAVLLLVAAMALAAFRGARRRPTLHADAAMTLHSTSGLVVMAALLTAMAAGGHTAAAATGHVHGASPSLLTVVVTAAVLAYAAVSTAATVRSRRWLDRAQYAGMGASALAMGVAALL
ncbi:hypothetical protein ACH3VR_18675 [Microbacterium sp. B2969]|uniref:DUF5134 domain-containing protein n=1 Tax=Microbacterium alkaliflavum TaxID=3248839 RepID=A0ABW7QBY1_9MICO